jgi:hypothetical protein
MDYVCLNSNIKRAKLDKLDLDSVPYNVPVVL